MLTVCAIESNFAEATLLKQLCFTLSSVEWQLWPGNLATPALYMWCHKGHISPRLVFALSAARCWLRGVPNNKLANFATHFQDIECKMFNSDAEQICCTFSGCFSFLYNWSDCVWALVAEEGVICTGQVLKVETSGSVPPFNVLLELRCVGKVARRKGGGWTSGKRRRTRRSWGVFTELLHLWARLPRRPSRQAGRLIKVIISSHLIDCRSGASV